MTQRELPKAIRASFVVLALAGCFPAGAQTPRPPEHRWTQFVPVEGQPELVPVEWVATPEGRFAHSIKAPKPLPKDSGYRRGMTSEQYFQHLCNAEAGEFIFKTIEDVPGLYFMRPPDRPTDDDLIDRYKLEAPEIERTFHVLRATPEERASIFINPPWAHFSFVEERNYEKNATKPYLRVLGYRQRVSPMRTEPEDELQSKYGLVWRGIKRPSDRELYIAGSEWLVIDLSTREVIALQRDYGRTGRVRHTTRGVWWLNAANCPQSSSKNIFGDRIYKFVSKALKPAHGDKR